MRTFVKTLLATVIAFFAVESVASAQLLKNLLNKATNAAETTVSTATSNGQAAGAALKSLYTQYKSAGKLDLNNLNNIMNLATLATNVKGLKGQTDKTQFYKDFATGLISGSSNLVTTNNSNAVMSGLQTLVNNVDLSSLQGKAADVVNSISTGSNASSENINQVASSVSNILKLFK
jgi:hypothetical protein